MLRFLYGLMTTLKTFHTMAIFEISSNGAPELNLANRIKSLVDGTMELRVEETPESFSQRHYKRNGGSVILFDKSVASVICKEKP